MLRPLSQVLLRVKPVMHLYFDRKISIFILIQIENHTKRNVPIIIAL